MKFSSLSSFNVDTVGYHTKFISIHPLLIVQSSLSVMVGSGVMPNGDQGIPLGLRKGEW
jgi:hypothetical protein